MLKKHNEKMRNKMVKCDICEGEHSEATQSCNACNKVVKKYQDDTRYSMEEERKVKIKYFMKKEFDIEIDDNYIKYYDQALTHYNDQRTWGTREPERLAFLGDAYLEFIVRKHLFNHKPIFSIGEMNDKKKLLVENEIWKKIAEEIGLGNQIVTVVQGIGHTSQRFDIKIEDRTILARSFEALGGVLSYDCPNNAENKLMGLFIKLGYLPNHDD